MPFGRYVVRVAGGVIALPAAMASVSIERWRREWVRIGWRIVSSWSGAIAVMYLAFELRRTNGGA